MSFLSVFFKVSLNELNEAARTLEKLDITFMENILKPVVRLYTNKRIKK